MTSGPREMLCATNSFKRGLPYPISNELPFGYALQCHNRFTPFNEQTKLFESLHLQWKTVDYVENISGSITLWLGYRLESRHLLAIARTWAGPQTHNAPAEHRVARLGCTVPPL